MPAQSHATLTGFKELGENLRNIDAELRAKIGYKAAFRVMKQTQKDAIENAKSQLKEGSGALFKNIVIARDKSVGPLAFAYVVGVRHGTRKQLKQTKQKRSDTKNMSARGDNDPWYWFLHEFGFANRGGGRVGPRPFLTPAFLKRESDGVAMMGDTIMKGIEKANKPAKGK